MLKNKKYVVDTTKLFNTLFTITTVIPMIIIIIGGIWLKVMSYDMTIGMAIVMFINMATYLIFIFTCTDQVEVDED